MGGSCSPPIRSRWSTACCCLYSNCFSYSICCHEQPPQRPKCIQNGSVRCGENALIAVTFPSRKELFIFVSITSTVSPGAPPSKKITRLLILETHFPSAAMVWTTRSSIMSPFFIGSSNYRITVFSRSAYFSIFNLFDGYEKGFTCYFTHSSDSSYGFPHRGRGI